MRIIGRTEMPEVLSTIFRKHSWLVIKRLDRKRLLNIALLLAETKLRRTELKSRPIIARMDTHPFCNLRCLGCMGKKEANSARHIMTFEEYKSIMDKIHRNLTLVILYDEGEPLLNKDLYRMIRYTNSLNVSTSVSSNLSMELSNEDIEELVSSGLDRLRVGMDGMSQDVYEQYRVGGDLELVKSNLERILRAKRKHHRRSPTVEVQYLNFGHNSHQLEKARAYARSIGADDFSSFRARSDDLWIPYEGPEMDRLRLGCSGLWMTLYIRSDGMLFPCNYGEDNEIAPVGSITRSDLGSLWNSDYLQGLRGSFQRDSKGLECELCKTCPTTQTLPRILR